MDDKTKQYVDQVNAGLSGLMGQFQSSLDGFKASLTAGGKEALEKHLIDPSVIKAAKDAANSAAKSIKDLQKNMKK